MTKFTRVWTLLASTSILFAFAASLALGGLPEKEKAALEKTTTNDLYRPFNINNVFNYYSNNGDGSYNKFSTDNEGFEFYKGSGLHIIFEDGVVWGGYHKGEAKAKVGGSTYRHGLQSGPIVTNGTATTNPIAAVASDPRYRIYRVRPDINPNVAFDAVEPKIQAQEVATIGRYESFSAKDIYDQYIQDWNEWPADLGAPYLDVNKDNKYDPKIDIPGQPGSDQTLWYVSNDLSASRLATLTGSSSIGLEMQRTVWGYNRAGALGNTIFQSTIIVNKSGAPIDSMYLVQWSDPDLGDAGDDYAGCDSSRSLGYVYNGKAVDANYGVAVPAGGYDFFQGPLVPSAGDSAVFKLHYRKGFRNLPMSTFVFFINGNNTFTDPTLGSGGEIMWWRLMRGLVSTTGGPFIDPNTSQPTTYCLAGDPVKGTGWIDGQGGLAAADRRICMVTGPFTMAAGDTQELVVANLAGMGADRLSSISVLRSVDDKAQQAYNNLFVLPSPPPVPNVVATPLDNEIVLSWGDSLTIANTEGKVDQGFAFQGYNLYEFSNAAGNNPHLIATYDLVDGVKTIADTIYNATTGLSVPTVLQLGSDNGIIHQISLTASKITARPLVNGTPYYFGVTAFSYNENPPAAAGTHSLESPVEIKTIVPEAPKPGTRLTQKAGDMLPVTLTSANGAAPSDGSVIAYVVDPTKLVGHSYAVTFALDGDDATYWKLTDKTTGRVLLDNQYNQSGDENYAIRDGILVKVLGPPAGMKDWSIPSGVRRFTWSGGNGYSLEGFNGAMGASVLFWGGSLTVDQLHSVLIKLAATNTAGDPLNAADTLVSYAYRFMRGAQNAAAKPEFAPFIVNPAASYAFQDYVKIPLAAYDIDVNPPQRLALAFLENNVANGLVDGKYWPPTTGTDNYNTTGAREWLWIFNTPYTGATPNTAFETNINTGAGALPLMWLSMADRNSASWSAGDQLEIISNHVNSVNHTFSFSSVAPTVNSAALAKVDIEKINVFPNPYIGFNPQEINKYARFVTFNHLPAKATIRIFSLAGVLVRTLQKNDATTQYFQWDLNNDKSFPVAAGMYIVYIDMPDLGVTKTLKMGVIPEQQYLDRW